MRATRVMAQYHEAASAMAREVFMDLGVGEEFMFRERERWVLMILRDCGVVCVSMYIYTRNQVHRSDMC